MALFKRSTNSFTGGGGELYFRHTFQQKMDLCEIPSEIDLFRAAAQPRFLAFLAPEDHTESGSFTWLSLAALHLIFVWVSGLAFALLCVFPRRRVRVDPRRCRVYAVTLAQCAISAGITLVLLSMTDSFDTVRCVLHDLGAAQDVQQVLESVVDYRYILVGVLVTVTLTPALLLIVSVAFKCWSAAALYLISGLLLVLAGALNFADYALLQTCATRGGPLMLQGGSCTTCDASSYDRFYAVACSTHDPIRLTLLCMIAALTPLLAVIPATLLPFELPATYLRAAQARRTRMNVRRLVEPSQNALAPVDPTYLGSATASGPSGSRYMYDTSW